MRRSMLLVTAALLGCSGSDEGEPQSPPLECGQGLEAFRGRCVDPATRYEPDAPLDADNVVAFGEPLSVLQLPPPPRSGFRLIAPPRDVAAGEEVSFCLSWPIPEVTRRVIYAGRLYTTPGLHHSNVISKPIDAELGENPYPECHPGASDPFSNIAEVIPDVLFANSTQVVGDETLAFPAGMGWRIDVAREVSTNMHFLNTTGEAARVEVAYDFFTMDEAELIDEVAPMFMQMNEFVIPAHTTKTIGKECKVFGGRLVSLMPHTHEWATRFTVDTLPYAGPEQRVMDDGTFDLESDIRIFDPALDLTDIDRMRFQCTFANTLDHDLHYGLGENEMCILFGYVTPPEYQLVAYAEDEAGPCLSVQIGLWKD